MSLAVARRIRITFLSESAQRQLLLLGCPPMMCYSWFLLKRDKGEQTSEIIDKQFNADLLACLKQLSPIELRRTQAEITRQLQSSK